MYLPRNTTYKRFKIGSGQSNFKPAYVKVIRSSNCFAFLLALFRRSLGRVVKKPVSICKIHFVALLWILRYIGKVLKSTITGTDVCSLIYIHLYMFVCLHIYSIYLICCLAMDPSVYRKGTKVNNFWNRCSLIHIYVCICKYIFNIFNLLPCNGFFCIL
jgi:hypothetical protein